jgi:hypothetical protein
VIAPRATISRLKSVALTIGFATVALGLLLGLQAPAAEAAKGIASFTTSSSATQAGGHPDLDTRFEVNTLPDGWPDGYTHSVRVELPPGVVGNPNAVPKCPLEVISQAALDTSGPVSHGDLVGQRCPQRSQVGIAKIYLEGTLENSNSAIFNVEPAANEPGALIIAGDGIPVTYITVGARTETDFGLSTMTPEVSGQLQLRVVDLTVWGVPGAHARGGDALGSDVLPPDPPAERKAFLSAPTVCDEPKVTELGITFQKDPGTPEYTATSTEPTPTGCEDVPFEPGVELALTSARAGDASGLRVELSVPQSNDPEQLASSHLRKAVVSLPAGVTVNPAAADGLEGCTDAQFGLGSRADATCPDASKVGSVSLDVPLLPGPLHGSLYLGTPLSTDPQSGRMFRIFQYAKGYGLTVKIPGYVKADPVSGRLTGSFGDLSTLYGAVPQGMLDGLPQVPFTKATLNFKGGPRGLLANPKACGTYRGQAELTPWSGNAAVELQPSLEIDQGCGQEAGFDPALAAGTADPSAGAHSSFHLRVTNSGSGQNIATIEATLPEGLTAKLAGVALCAEAEAAAGDCPAASRVGTTTVGAGSGPSPLYVPQPGKAPTAVYLAGPYKGAPYSLMVRVPAQAGPFDLGTVWVRNALYVDPTTAKVTAKSDPLPQILSGIPVSYRDIRVDVSRPDFVLNPTSCDPMAITSAIGSVAGSSAAPSSRFQARDCARLGFKPKLRLSLKGATNRGAYPKLKAVLTQPEGQANIDRVSVALPHSAFLAQEHIRTICTRVQYAADQCPKGSIYGKARALTPLLDQPLEGPVYLRSSSNPLPDLVVALHGQIDVDLSGRIDSVDGGIRNTFSVVPDAPVTKFVLEMQGGKKGLLVNSRNICKSRSRATVKMSGQNGKAHDFNPVLKAQCPKGK